MANSQSRAWQRWGVAMLAGIAGAATAQAQLAQDQVLVVYDSRIPDSRAVAEYYAGSRKVPGAQGGLAGVRPGVRVVNLATLGAGQTSPGNITYAGFVSNLRDPLRAHLSAQGLTTRVRALVMTKGLPHRVEDIDNSTVGDFPGSFVPEIEANDATCASVDIELALLWQDLSSGESGGSGDSRADGLIANPFWKAFRPMHAFNNAFITSAKTLTPTGLGPYWALAGTPGTSSRLNTADIYLVTRLDGDSVQDVRGMIDRAQVGFINVSTAALLFDEDGADLDNIGSAFPNARDGDDYEVSVTALTNDRRFSFTFPSPPPNVRYNDAASAAQFFVGPLLAYPAGQGVLVTSPVLLLATYGANHNGVPQPTNGAIGGTVYAESFAYAPGAIFNTIESFNGRDFGGLGQLSFAQQQQAADFLRSGGTFAVCNVWEPLADTVPDNRYLVNNFVLGTMTFAEAAYSSLPVLSWMQMAVGDPLARMTRSSEDIDASQRVGADDVYAWEALPAGAAGKDINRSGAADTADRALILSSVRASERVLLTTR